MSVPIVTPGDLGLYLGDPGVDEDRAVLLLGLAQSLCEAIVDPLPAAAAAVVLDVAARAYSNPRQAQSQAAGPFSVNYGPVSGGLWLTRANKAALRRLGGSGGAFTFDTMPATAGQYLPPWDTEAGVYAGDGFDDFVGGGFDVGPVTPVTYPAGETVTVTRRTVTGHDRLGGEVFTDVSTDLAGAAFDPGGSVETLGGLDLLVASPQVFLPAGTVLAATDRVVVRGVTYDVDGAAADWRSPWTGWRPGVVVRLKSVAG